MKTTAIAVSAISLCLSACNPFEESGFSKACEAAIQGRLKAPSTYKRIDLVRTTEPISFEEYAKKRDWSPVLYEAYKKDGHKYVRHTATITYEASNSFGVPVRSVLKCTHETSEGEEPTDSKYLVSLETR